MAALDREPLLSFEGIQTHRHAERQNRPELRRHYPPCSCRDRIALIESQQALEHVDLSGIKHALAALFASMIHAFGRFNLKRSCSSPGRGGLAARQQA